MLEDLVRVVSDELRRRVPPGELEQNVAARVVGHILCDVVPVAAHPNQHRPLWRHGPELGLDNLGALDAARDPVRLRLGLRPSEVRVVTALTHGTFNGLFAQARTKVDG